MAAIGDTDRFFREIGFWIVRRQKEDSQKFKTKFRKKGYRIVCPKKEKVCLLVKKIEINSFRGKDLRYTVERECGFKSGTSQETRQIS